MDDIKQLYCYGKDNLSLKTALQECQYLLQGAVALIYSLEKCQFAKVSENSLLDTDNQTIAIDNFGDRYIFEARVFHPNCELRWLNLNNGMGQGALISEQANPQLTGSGWQDNSPLKYLEFLPQKYLLWGQKSDAVARAGWQKLSSARIGTLAVPLKPEITEEQRVYLKTQEYLAQIDTNGNVAVIEERLIKLEVE